MGPRAADGGPPSRRFRPTDELAVEREIRHEKARTLGRTGERLEAACHEAWALWRAGRRGERLEPGAYARARERAASLRHQLILQREAIRLRSHAEVDRCYPLPPEPPATPRG